MTVESEERPAEMSFTAPPVRVSFDGFLFDMDGTIIDSTDAVVKHWETVGNEIGVAPEVILETSHGRRSIDILKILAPEKANWEYVCHMESLLPKLHGKDAVEIPGARALLGQLIPTGAPWAVVTSGTLPLVTGWLGVLGLPRPEHLVTAESVAEGKPDPGCYLLGLEKLGFGGGGRSQGKEQNGKEAENGNRDGDASRVLVLEDSPAGIRAGKAAGCRVLGLVTSHTAEQVLGAEPDWIVRDLRSVRVVEAKGGVVTLELSDALVVAPEGR